MILIGVFKVSFKLEKPPPFNDRYAFSNSENYDDLEMI